MLSTPRELARFMLHPEVGGEEGGESGEGEEFSPVEMISRLVNDIFTQRLVLVFSSSCDLKWFFFLCHS